MKKMPKPSIRVRTKYKLIPSLCNLISTKHGLSSGRVEKATEIHLRTCWQDIAPIISIVIAMSTLQMYHTGNVSASGK